MLRILTIGGIISLCTNLALGLFVYSRNKERSVNKYFALFSISIAIWSAGSFLANAGLGPSVALIVLRFAYVAAVFLPTFYIHFISHVVEKFHKRKRVIAFLYGASIVLSLFLVSSKFIAGVRLTSNDFFVSQPGPAYYVFFVFMTGCTIYGLYSLVTKISEVQGYLRKKLIWMFSAQIIAQIAAFEYFSTIFKWWDHIPFDDYILVGHFTIMSYAILRHNLLDIEVIIKRTLIFAGIVGAAVMCSSLTLSGLQLLIGQIVGIPVFLMIVAAVTTTVFLYHPLEVALVNLTDRFLFQKKFDYHKLLKESSKQMAFIQSFNDLAKQIIVFLLKQGRIKNAAMLVASADQKAFVLNFPLGYGGKKSRPHMILEVNHALIRYLEKKHAPVELDEIESEMKAKNAIASVEIRELEVMRDTLLALRATVVIPAFLGISAISSPSLPRPAINLRTILVLGAKKSDEPYTEEDLNVFFTLAQESAIAVENARLYDEAVKRAKELENINREMNLASTRLLKALAETEEANKRLKDTQSQLVHEQKMATLGRLAASVGHEVNNPLTVLSMNVSRVLLRLRREPELKVDEIMPVFDKMEHNIARIKAVVNTLTGLLKKSERGRYEALSVKILIEETLPLVQFQTYLDNLSGTEVEFDIPADTWLVKGDLERLQEVFLNLFINAYQAMQGHNERKIRISARNEIETKRVIIEFSDNGSGMSEEVVKKIFSFRFTTKKEGKGSGIGLYMCRYIIELHGGEISVRAKPEEGATFIVKIPMFEELRGRSVMTASGGTQ